MVIIDTSYTLRGQFSNHDDIAAVVVVQNADVDLPERYPVALNKREKVVCRPGSIPSSLHLFSRPSDSEPPADET